MTDFIDGLERDLVDAAQRQSQARRTATAVRRRRFSGRGLAVALAALVVAGSATAAVVSTTGQPSRPLAGPQRESAPNAGAYEIALHPDLRAGQAGWCTSISFTKAGRPVSSGMGCGPPRAKGGNMIAAGGAAGTNGRLDAVRYAVVTSRVRAVRFGPGRVVATRPDPTLPYGWRFAVSIGPGRRPGSLAPPVAPNQDPSAATTPAPATKPRPGADQPYVPVTLDRSGRELPSTTPAGDRQRGGRSRLVTRHEPARRCVIGRARGYVAGYARVAVSAPRVAPRLEGRAFFSCAYTVFHTRDERSHMTAAILLDALDRTRPAADLPPARDLSGRRLGKGWLVVRGATAPKRARLLRRLHPRLQKRPLG